MNVKADLKVGLYRPGIPFVEAGLQARLAADDEVLIAAPPARVTGMIIPRNRTWYHNGISCHTVD